MRRKSEEAARQSEMQFRLLIDGVRDYAVYMLDPDGYIQSWNKGAELMKGYSAQEVIGQHYSIFFREEDRKEGLPAWQLQRALLHGRTEEEGWRIRKDGSAFWANIVINPIVQADGSVAGYSKVTRDMSDRARLHELEHSLQHMNEFLAMLGHELRNPLAAMQNALFLLQSEDAPSARQRMSRDVLDRQLTQLSRLLNDLLDAGRLTSGKLHIRTARVGFKAVVNDAVEAIRPRLNERLQILDVHLPHEAIWVNADEIRLYQVLQNLLSNASKFTPEGGRIRLRGAVADGRLYVDISDNGIGMAPSTLDKVFTLFAQADAQENDPSAGLGIGLALARSIVELHGGKISAESAGLGKGSTLSFELPNATLEEESAALPRSPA
ncbi:MAG TPA: ATP-binding protein, partial [Hydrogenophaga sp.]|nr:ATP-binding protein [Hydrogenophaga sp.]